MTTHTTKAEILHINSATPAPFALFEETILAFQIVQTLGKGALDIAVVSDGARADTEHKILEIGEIMALNQANPGEFAEWVFKVRQPDRAGRPRPIVREGNVKRVMVHWAGQSANLMRGMRRRDLAKFLKMAPTDKRIDQIMKGIQVALENGLGVRAGWYEGRFRILTAKQVEKKSAALKKGIEGSIKTIEKDQTYLRTRGAEEVGTASFTLTLFSDLPEVSDALN